MSIKFSEKTSQQAWRSMSNYIYAYLLVKEKNLLHESGQMFDLFVFRKCYKDHFFRISSFCLYLIAY